MSCASQVKLAVGGNGPAHVVPVEPSGNVHVRPSTEAEPCVTTSETRMSVRDCVPEFTIVNTSPVVPSVAVRSTAESAVCASFPATSFFLIEMNAPSVTPPA